VKRREEPRGGRERGSDEEEREEEGREERRGKGGRSKEEVREEGREGGAKSPLFLSPPPLLPSLPRFPAHQIMASMIFSSFPPLQLTQTTIYLPSRSIVDRDGKLLRGGGIRGGGTGSGERGVGSREIGVGSGEEGLDPG
jgi:hypothetical protein